MKHLLSLKELNKSELSGIIQKALEIKQSSETFFHACERKGLLMLFQKTSTRTNLSFQSGINQMGGYSVPIDGIRVILVSPLFNMKHAMYQGIVI